MHVKEITEIDYAGKRMMVYHSSFDAHCISYTMRQGQIWDKEVIDYIKENIADKELNMVDVGVEVGSYSIMLCDHFKKITGFEPNLNNYKVFSHTIKINGIDNIELHNKGCGAINSVCSLTSKNSDQISVGQGTIPLVTLDSLDLDNCKFLKIDVEGHEFEVLKGAKNFINKHKPYIYLETHPGIKLGVKELSEQWLTENGYEVIHEVTPIDKFWKYVG